MYVPFDRTLSFHKNMIRNIKNDDVTRTVYKIVTFKDQDERIDHMAIYISSFYVMLSKTKTKTIVQVLVLVVVLVGLI